MLRRRKSRDLQDAYANYTIAMEILVYLKWPFVLMLAGLIIRTIGAMLKILHWVGGNMTLLTGTIVIIVSLCWLVVKILMLKKPLS